MYRIIGACLGFLGTKAARRFNSFEKEFSMTFRFLKSNFKVGRLPCNFWIVIESQLTLLSFALESTKELIFKEILLEHNLGTISIIQYLIGQFL